MLSTRREISPPPGAAGSLFSALDVYHDIIPRAAAMNMAIDEALLESVSAPSIRFYRWDHPALSFGYFGKFAEVAEQKRDLVRRWTGGGIVLHGEDLTYSIMIPAGAGAFGHSPTSIYEQTHRAIRLALGPKAELAEKISPKISESCFANPVRADVMMNGRKVAGAAQRRTRRGLLQQGSIQQVDLAPNFEMRFARELSAKPEPANIDHKILERAREIADAKYATQDWLRRR
jgi:lipoate-protein ligase A